VSAENDLDKTSAAQLAAQIRVGNILLQGVDGRQERTFTSPCGDLLAAGENYLGRIGADFVAIKSAAGGVVADMTTLDPYGVSVAAPSNATGAQLIELVQRAARAGTMANITFHGLAGGHLGVSRLAHEDLPAHLSAHLSADRDVCWTDTFIGIMKHVKARPAARSGPGPK